MKHPLSLKPEDWPEIDRTLWTRARAPAGFLEAANPASNWSAARVEIGEQSYGQWLSWQLRTGNFDPHAAPKERATRQLMAKFIADLQTRVAPVSVTMMVGALKRMLDVLAPESDWGWLQEWCARLKTEAKPSRNRFGHAQPPEVLFGLGLELMDGPLLAGAQGAYHRATQFRDGLIIAVLICCPVRIANLAEIKIGAHLQFDGEHYQLSFSSDETKTGHPCEAALPLELSPYIDEYLTVYRKILTTRKTDRPCQHLWIDRLGKAMTASTIRNQINKRTRDAFGQNVWPHLFRHCAVTGLIDHAPEDIQITPDLLGHASINTTQKHYILANGTRAHQAVQNTLMNTRKSAKERRKRSYD